MKASCQSITSDFLKLSESVFNEYQELRKSAARVLVGLVPEKIASSKDLKKLTNQAIDSQTNLLKHFGVAVGQSKGKIGPRYQIIPTKKVTGDLATERTFIVTPSPFDKVIVTIQKTGGRAGADIAVCAKYENGSIYNEKRKSIGKGNDSKGESARIVMANMANKLLTIHLVKTGFPTNTCDYSLSIEGEFTGK